MRFLAVDWDCREARAVLVEKAARGPRLIRAVNASVDGETTLADSKKVGRRLAEALSNTSAGKPVTIVGMGRDHVQLQRLSLPPAPAEELPDIVRFQAQRELTSLGDDAPLDFLPLSTSTDGPQEVLAAALSAEGLAAAHVVSQALGTDAAHITIRSAGAASLLARATQFESNAVALLVCPLAEEADLTVVADGQPVLMRTVRLPIAEVMPEANDGDTDTESSVPTEASLQGFMAMGLDRRHAALASEIRRTLAAARQQLGEQSVGIVYLCGDAESTAAPAALIGRQLELPCVAFDPFADVPTLAGGAAAVEGGQLSRFSAVLGMALDAAEDRPPAIDFLNARRREEVQPVRRVHVLAAAAVVACLLGYGWHLYSQLAYPTRMTDQYQSQIDELQTSVDQFAEVQAEAAAVERWLATDVLWLDELERLSVKLRPEALDSKEFPVADDAVVTWLIMQRPRRGLSQGGIMKVTAAARTPGAVAPLEARLRDDEREVTGGRGEQEESMPGYPWTFDLEVVVPAAALDGTGGPSA